MAINFLLGHGERLTKPIPPPGRKGRKSHPYTFSEAQLRLAPLVQMASRELDALPKAACPRDEAVAVFTLHPTYLAKSYYPISLLEKVHLHSVGSRLKQISPEKWTTKDHPERAATAELFIAGPRRMFREWAATITGWQEKDFGAEDIRKLEVVRSFTPKERLRPQRSESESPLWEIVLHADPQPQSDFIIEGFRSYLDELDIQVDLDRRLYAEGLCFIPLKVPSVLIGKVAEFSFLRVVREMPTLRPITRAGASRMSFGVDLPDTKPIDPQLRAAVFDGGIPAIPEMSPWVRRLKTNKIGSKVPEYEEHGLAVTSALLFGPLEQGASPEKPYGMVDHYRVLDEKTKRDSQGDLYDVLKRIQDVLETKKYEFVNISIGPDLPIDDEDIHAWTAVLDQIFSSGQIVPTIAVGNGGENDWESGNARIQSPADCVNGLSIGACDNTGKKWKRASYSSIGPGRSPGLVKPDAVAFGGSQNHPFWVLDTNGKQAAPTLGTSFAAPLALRSAMGIRAHLGNQLTPLSIKTILLHNCEVNSEIESEVGRGRVQTSIERLITSDEFTAHIVYQGELHPSQWLRAQIPLPTGSLPGIVEIKATICFASETDPQDPINYTRSGLDVIFRPDIMAKKDPRQRNADSKSFFRSNKSYLNELELRLDAQKWEPCLHALKRIRGNSLNNPCFDIHYNARESGRNARSPSSIPYSIVVTVQSKNVPDMYDRIVRQYRTILEVLRPVIQIPVRASK